MLNNNNAINNSGHFYSAVYLADKGEHTALYKINNNVEKLKPKK